MGEHYKYVDERKAYDWYQKAANAGSQEAMLKLGDTYRYVRDK
jgi:TPR repeat protein